MFSDKVLFFTKNILFTSLLACFPLSVQAMGGKPESAASTASSTINAPVSNVTLKELAQIYWPDSNATELQQEETLKNLLGKRVTWNITVAQIQRDGNGYLVQGQSDKNMVGTFSYVTPENEAQKEAILKASMGSELTISGIVNDMQMRHIILKPATILLK